MISVASRPVRYRTLLLGLLLAACTPATAVPTLAPTTAPTLIPTTPAPTAIPPTLVPTDTPTAVPTDTPTPAPTYALPLFNDAVSDINVAGQIEAPGKVWDAAPDPEGETIYFTAHDGAGVVVFSTTVGGGETWAMALGAPLVEPVGLAVDPDGQTIYVADVAAGQLFSVTTAVFTFPVALPNTAGTLPRGLEVTEENGATVIYFSGVDPSDGQPAVMKVAADGSGFSVVAKGAPLVQPVGIAVTRQGTVYVSDPAAAGDGLGSVFAIVDGKVETIATGIRGGDPMGIALTLDEGLLLVSALDIERGSSQVYVLQLASGEAGLVTEVIEANVGSGGVHRAYNQNILAWAGIAPGGGGGLVYRIGLNP